MTLKVWATPIFKLKMTTHTGATWWIAPPFSIHQPVRFTLDLMLAECSDYDTEPDIITCPCGQEIEDWDRSIGDALRRIRLHCDEAGHARPEWVLP